MKKIIVVILISLSSITLFGQNEKTASITKEIQSKVYEKERTISIYLPPYYKEDKDLSYPVMYVFDGQAEPYGDFTYGLKNYLSMIGSLEDYIIVTIHHDNRGPELTPKAIKNKEWVNDPDFGWGKSDKLDAFLEKEIFPYINKTYRTNGFVVGVGHSLGGTYLVNTKANNKNFFHSIIAISPNLKYDLEAILDKIEKNKNLNGFWYVAIGDTGNMDNLFRPGVKRLDYMLSKRWKNKNLKIQFDYVKDADHGTIFAKALPLSFLALNEKTTFTEKALVEISKYPDFITKLEKQYNYLASWKGVKMNITKELINGWAYKLYYQDYNEKGIELLEWGMQKHPNWYNFYDSKGELLLDIGKLEEAKHAYNKAIQVAKLNTEKLDKKSLEELIKRIKDNRQIVIDKINKKTK